MRLTIPGSICSGRCCVEYLLVESRVLFLPFLIHHVLQARGALYSFLSSIGYARSEDLKPRTVQSAADAVPREL